MKTIKELKVERELAKTDQELCDEIDMQSSLDSDYES